MTEHTDTEHTATRWERRTQGPLLALAVLFAVAYAVPVVEPDADPAIRRLCWGVEWTVWGAFAVDYAVRLMQAPDRFGFVRSNPLALLAVALPLIQPLRLLRLIAALILVGTRARMAPQVRLTTYVAGAVVGLLMFGSLAVLDAERDSPEGNIKNLGDAVWWSFTTMTTVGYGDHSPTTGLGRVLAVGLMLSGIALLGVVTANIAAWFIARFEREEAEERRQARAIETLAEEVRSLRAEVSRLTAMTATAPPEKDLEAAPGANLRAAPAAPPAASAAPAEAPTGLASPVQHPLTDHTA